MNLKKLLTPKQIEICQQEKAYYQRLGVKKNILQIAIEHNFIQKKEQNSPHSLELIKKYEIIIANERANAKTFFKFFINISPPFIIAF